jgi:hypothetical protein
MLDLLEHMDLLKSPRLQLENLALCGVHFGSVAREFPVHLVSEVTLAPIVVSSSWSLDRGSVYRDASGKELAKAEVIASVVESGGILHFPEKVSFKIEEGRVVGFSIYGTHLDAFQHIKSNEQLVAEFGKADVVLVNEAHGDLMGYEHYYAVGGKCVTWDEWKKKIVVINLGFRRHVPSDA